MIERSGKRGSGISVLAARHDDDDNIVQSKQIHKIFTNNFVHSFDLIFICIGQLFDWLALGRIFSWVPTY